MDENRKHLLLGTVLLFVFAFCIVFGYLIMDVLEPIFGMFLILVGIQALTLRLYLRFKRMRRLSGKKGD